MTEAELSTGPRYPLPSVHNVVCFVISLFLIHIQKIHGYREKIIILCKCLQILLSDAPQLWLKLGPNLAADQIKADMKAVLSSYCGFYILRLGDLLSNLMAIGVFVLSDFCWRQL